MIWLTLASIWQAGYVVCPGFIPENSDPCWTFGSQSAGERVLIVCTLDVWGEVEEPVFLDTNYGEFLDEACYVGCIMFYGICINGGNGEALPLAKKYVEVLVCVGVLAGGGKLRWWLSVNGLALDVMLVLIVVSLWACGWLLSAMLLVVGTLACFKEVCRLLKLWRFVTRQWWTAPFCNVICTLNTITFK